MKSGYRLAAGLAVALLAGCGSGDVTSYMIDGNETALTLERNKDFPWSGDWDLDLIVRHVPDCQRRHKLQPSAAEPTKIELFSPEPLVFVLREGKRWYVTDLKSCSLQTFKSPPPEPGAPVGAFVEKDGAFAFEKKKP